MLHKLKNVTYYKKIIFALTLFTLLVCIPYIFILYNTSRNAMLKTISDANNQSLQQLKYNYTSTQETMANLCMSIYLDSQSQSLMYNHTVSYGEVNEHMLNLRNNFLSIYPSIYAVTIYNGNEDKIYTTLNNPERYSYDLPDSFLDMKYLPRLQPILRQVPYNGTQTYIYVFSYYIYDFTDNENKPLSYIVLDENAGWVLDNFVNIIQSNNAIPTRLYLLDRKGEICSTTPENISETDLKILSNVSSNRLSLDNSSSSSYTETVNGKEYLVTGLSLNAYGDSIVMIQDSDDVFAEFISLRKAYLIILAVWITLYILAIFIISRKLYQPVGNLMEFVNDLSGQEETPPASDEFTHFMELYRDFHQKLLDKNNARQYFIRHYQLEKLLTDESDATWKNFCDSSPGHWLTEPGPHALCTVCLKLDTMTTDGKPILEDEYQLYLFIIQNIFTELTEPHYPVEIFSTDDGLIWGILDTGNDFSYLEEALHETQLSIKQYVPITFCAAYSHAYQSPSELHIAGKETLNLLNYSFIWDASAIITPEVCVENLANTATICPPNLEKKLLNALKYGNWEEANGLLDEIFDFVRTMKYENIQFCIMNFINHVNYTLKEISTAKGALTKFSFEDVYHQIMSARSLGDIQAQIKKYIQSALLIFNQKNDTDKKQTFLADITEYVEANYSNANLSSQEVGDHMGLSGKYVMKKFQDYTGSSLTDFITSVRMRKAAELLTATNLSIGKISEQVGLPNENYFYRLFKKTYGCTPREYSARNAP